MTVILMHALAVYAVVLAPLLGVVWYRQAKRRVASGDPLAKVKLYRWIVIEQVVSTAAALAWWRFAGVPGPLLGLGAPRSWTWNTVALVALSGWLLWEAARLRPKAEKIRSRFKDSLGTMMPDTPLDRSWFGAVSIGAGISEELVFRGFLIYYLSVVLPHTNLAERVLLTSLSFGFGHIYQGRTRAISAGIVGLVLACFYVASGSLLLPMVLHAVADYRLLLILPPEAPQAAASSA